jgi:steroid delta-isomerase-like uncharacterized protein
VLTEEIKELLRRAGEEIWHKGNLAPIDELAAADFVFHPATGEDVYGPEGYKQYVIRLRNAFPDIHFTADDPLVEGGKAVWRWTMTGTHKGELKGIPPTGKKVMISGSACTASSATSSWKCGHGMIP